MPDILDNGPAQVGGPIDLTDLVQTNPLPTNPPPVPATRNQAALTALTASPQDVQTPYNQMMAEAQQGDNTTQTQLRSQLQGNQKQQDMGTLMSMLSDRNVPMATKQAAVDNFNNSMKINDTSTILTTGLLQAPSQNETVDAENARISTADALNEMYDSRVQIQNMSNQLKQTADSDNLFTKVLDGAADFIPGRAAVDTNKTLSDLSNATGIDRGWWQNLTSMLWSGTQIQDARKMISQLPPDKQLTVAKQMFDAVQNRSGFLYGSDNHQEAFEQFNKLFGAGYGNGSALLDNFGGLLDMFAMGQAPHDVALLGKNLATMSGRQVPLVGQEAADFIRSNPTIQSSIKQEPTFGQTVDQVTQGGAQQAPQAAQGAAQPTGQLATQLNPGTPMIANPAVSALQNEKANLLPIAGNQPQAGNISIADQIAQASSKQIDSVQDRTRQLQATGMKFGDAQDLAERQIAQETGEQTDTINRLQNQLDAQKAGSQASQRISEIDQQISGMPDYVPAKLNPITESVQQTFQRLGIQRVVHDVNPNSPFEIAQNANPTAARSFQQAIVKGDPELSEALTGVDQTQAIANSTLPQFTETGTVLTRTADIDQALRQESLPDPSLVDLVKDTGVNVWTPMEKATIRAQVAHDFGNITGLAHNDSMSSMSIENGRVMAKQVYEVPAGSFSNPQQAIDQAKYALRQYGIEDKDITLLKKQGVQHVPISLEDARGVDGDYKIQVTANPEISPSFLSKITEQGEGGWQNLSVKRNMFDRFAGSISTSRGSLTRYLLDASDTLDKTLTGAHVVAKDYVSRFLKGVSKDAQDFAKSMHKFPSARQDAINDYLREANFKGIDFNQADLAARGFNAAETDAISKFRSFWDNHHYLENLDVVRSLRNQGYEYFKNANAELYARPMGKTTSVTRFYDPATDAVRSFNPGELDDLYTRGGNIAKLRRPTDFNGETVEHMIVRNTPGEYTRVLNDADQVLNKRPGYFGITYKAPRFIDEIDANGNKVKTVGVAGTTNEANLFADRMRSADPSKYYRIRSDTRGYKVGTDEHWDLAQSSGRIAQRHRGVLLEDASGANHMGDLGYVESPAASAIRAAQSISGRTVMRNVIDTAAERFMNQYKDVLPKDQYGAPRFPGSAEEIGIAGLKNTKQAADARTTWEYINFMRHGYVNSVNDAWKAVFNTLADHTSQIPLVGTGKVGDTLERGLRTVGENEPTGKLKRTVFGAYLAANPLHELFMQPQYAWRILQYNPMGILNGKVLSHIGDFYNNYALGGAETAFTKFVDKSGLLDIAGTHNMIGDALGRLADQQTMLSKGYTTVTDAMRRVGFDTGEIFNHVAHLASVYEKYARNGANMMSRDVQQEVQSTARALMFDMNAAGEMPYNQGTVAGIMQFMQMPHKAALQLVNRRLDVPTRMRMFAGDMLLWGTAVEGLSNMLGVNILPRDNNNAANSIIHDGLISWGYNHAINAVFPGTKEINFSNLAPVGLDGWMKLFHNAVLGPLPLVQSSASAQFMTSKFAQVYRQMASVFSPQPYDSRNTPEKFLDTVHAVAQLSAGFSNAERAIIMMKTKEERDNYGMLLDKDTTDGDAIARMFGYESWHKTEQFQTMQDTRQDNLAFRTQVLKNYNVMKQFYAQQFQDGSVPDMERANSIVGATLQMYENNPAAMQIIKDQWRKDMLGKDNYLAQQMLRSFNRDGHDDTLTKIQAGPWDDKTKAQMVQMLDFAKQGQATLDQYSQEGNQ